MKNQTIFIETSREASFLKALKLEAQAKKLEQKRIPFELNLTIRQKLIIVKNKMRLKAIYLLEEVCDSISISELRKAING